MARKCCALAWMCLIALQDKTVTSLAEAWLQLGRGWAMDY